MPVIDGVGRLAFRAEGSWWVAYFARTTGMEDAIELGRIAIGIVSKSEDCKQSFMDVMKLALEAFFEERGTPVDHWNKPEVAPESEKSGSA